MKRMLMAGVAVVGLAVAAGSARADDGWGGAPGYGGMPSGGYSPPPSYGAPPQGGGGDGKFGLFPGLRGLFAKKPSAGCDTCGGAGGHPHMGHGGGYGGPGGPGMGGPGGPGMGGPGGPGMGGPGGLSQQQGTLVFPNHPFVRSPRDYFMWGN